MLDSSQKPAGGRFRVGVVFERFGPYHIARLNAAQKRMEVTGVEVCGNTSVYLWEKVAAPGSFQRVTLFPDRTSETLSLEEMRGAYAQLDKFQFDVITVHGWADKWSLTLMEWALRRGVPMVVMNDSNEWDFPRSWLKEWIKGRLVRLCSAGLVPSAPHAVYVAKLGVPKDKIGLGYGVVDNDHFARGAEEARRNAAALKARYGLPQTFFLVCARFVSCKNLPALLRAYARYRELASRPIGPEGRPAERAKPWGLVLRGDGPLKDELGRLIGELGIADAVTLPGFAKYEELPIYYGLADAFLLGSTYETWGLVVNEAMAAGLPVLISRRCGCAEVLVEEGVNGFTFDPMDVESWAEVMLRLSSDPAAARRMGEKSREIIRRWTPDTFAAGLLLAAEAALAEPVRPGLSSRLVLRAALSPLRWRVPAFLPGD